jgi:hypothetical protein
VKREAPEPPKAEELPTGHCRGIPNGKGEPTVMDRLDSSSFEMMDMVEYCSKHFFLRWF